MITLFEGSLQQYLFVYWPTDKYLDFFLIIISVFIRPKNQPSVRLEFNGTLLCNLGMVTFTKITAPNLYYKVSGGYSLWWTVLRSTRPVPDPVSIFLHQVLYFSSPLLEVFI